MLNSFCQFHPKQIHFSQSTEATVSTKTDLLLKIHGHHGQKCKTIIWNDTMISLQCYIFSISLTTHFIKTDQFLTINLCYNYRKPWFPWQLLWGRAGAMLEHPSRLLYRGLRVSQWHKLCWSHAGITLAGTTGQPRQSRSFPGYCTSRFASETDWLFISVLPQFPLKAFLKAN